MEIFKVSADCDRFQNFFPVHDDDITRIPMMLEERQFKRLGRKWKPLEIELDVSTRRQRKTDFTRLAGAWSMPLFSQRGVDALGSALRDNGELLPVKCGQETYYIFHCLRVLDAIDYEKSNCERYDDGDVQEIIDYTFRPDALEDVAIFRLLRRLKIADDLPWDIRQIAESRRNTDGTWDTAWLDLFVTDAFFDAVKQAELQGFVFELVWPKKLVRQARQKTQQTRTARKRQAASRQQLAASAWQGKVPTVPPPEDPFNGLSEMPPDPEKFLVWLWEAVINRRMTGEWMDDLFTAAGEHPDQALTTAAADALERLLKKGARAEDLCILARSLVAEGAWEALAALAHPGVQSYSGDDQVDFEELANGLMGAAPPDAQGRAGGWPPVSDKS